jgi:hypothetical protein
MSEVPAPPSPELDTASDTPAMRALEVRISHLERMVESLQDSVHRESERQSRRIGELEARIEPAALGVALNRHAREHGL